MINNPKIQLTEIIAQENLKLAFKKYGIEGTEEKIHEVYKLNSKIKEIMLINYRKILKGESYL